MTFYYSPEKKPARFQGNKVGRTRPQPVFTGRRRRRDVCHVTPPPLFNDPRGFLVSGYVSRGQYTTGYIKGFKEVG